MRGRMLRIMSLSQPLLVSEQRRSLAILADNLSAREGIAAQKSRHADSERKEEQDTTDGESEDPLQLQDGQLAKELADTGS